MSPYELKLLMHILVTSADFSEAKGKLFYNTIKKFCEKELIECGETSICGYRLTPLGKAFMKSILATPLPKLVYVNNLNEIIK